MPTQEELLNAVFVNTNNTPKQTNNSQYVYDADTLYQNGNGYRVEGIDAPEMPSYALKQERIAKALKSKLGRFVSKATAGEAAKLEAELSTLNFNGIDSGFQETSFNDNQLQPTYQETPQSDSKGVYGRDILNNPAYQNELVAKGYAIPAFDNQTPEGQALMLNAKKQKLGLWADPEYAAEMEAVANKRGTSTVEEIPEYNILRGVGSAGLDVAAKVGGLIGETIESAGEGIGVDAVKNSGTALQNAFTEFQRKQYGKEITGYVSRNVDELSAEIDDTIKKDGYMSAIAKAVTDPRSLEVLANSVPEMIALAASVGGMAVANVNNNINMAEAELGRKLDTKEKVLSASASIVGTYMDRFGDKLALSGMNPTKEALKTVINKMSQEGKNTLSKKYGKEILTISSAPLRLASAGAIEGLTEKGQTMLETAAQTPRVFEEGFTKEELDESNVAGVLGVTMGTQMASPKVVYDVATKTVPSLPKASKDILERATETEAQRKVRETTEVSAPIREAAIDSTLKGDTDSVVKSAEEMHGKLAKELDGSAPKKYTYNVVLSNALNRAHESNDDTAIANVYKTIGDLNNRKDVDFKASEMVDSRMYEATKEFLDLVNKNDLTATDKMEAINLGKKIGENATEQSASKSNILTEVRLMKEQLEKEKKSLKSVKGSEDFGGPIDKLMKIVDDYLENRDAEKVNAQVMDLGYIELDPTSGVLKADPNRPGLRVYAKELEKQMLNPNTNKNLLDKKVVASGQVTIPKLAKFAKSRLDKLNPYKDNSAYQTSSLLNTLKAENEQMSNTIVELVKIASKLEIDKEIKDKYVAKLKEAGKSAVEANKEMLRREKLINDTTKPSGNGQLAFQVDPDGTESIRLVSGESNTKVADVVDGKVVPIAQEQNAEQVADKPLSNASIVEKAPTKESMKEEGVRNAKNVTTAPKPKQTVVQWLTAQLDEMVDNQKKTMVEAAKEINDYLSAQGLDKDTITKYNVILRKLVKDRVDEKKTPLNKVRARVSELDTELSKLVENVEDMNMLVHVKEYYKRKLGEVQAERTTLNKVLDRMEAELTKRTGTNRVSKLRELADKLIKGMVRALQEVKKRINLVNAEHDRLTSELNEISTMIKTIEEEYIGTVEPEIETRQTSIGEITRYEDSAYGPMVELGNKRVNARRTLSPTGKVVQSPSSALNDAMEVLKQDKIEELNAELTELASEGITSLGAKILKRNLENFPIVSPVHKILTSGYDSVFGKLEGNIFKDADKLLEVLPKGFKDFFASDKENEQALIDNFQTMSKYIENTKIGDIKIGSNRISKHIDQFGLVMNQKLGFVPIERQLIVGDRVKIGETTYLIGKIEGDKATVTIPGKKGTSTKKLSEFQSVREKQPESFPVDIIELIGTVKDDKLEIDEQTETILKFYTAKMVTDTQAMIGKILSFDESEMGLYLGITDPDEQIKVKQDAQNGLVNSASVRSDIGNEVYQALGIKLTKNTPEFTEESLTSALGVLVQAIAVDNGTMSMDKLTAEKNTNLIQVNRAAVDKALEVDGRGTEQLAKAMSKLQYLNEARNRPLPKTAKPKRKTSRNVMNTKIPMDALNNDKLNDMEQIAYTISPKLQMWLAMDETEALKARGYVEVESAGLHISEQDAQQARNDKLVREWEILKIFAQATKNKKFYLDWGQTVSGRFTILNDIQYQESKLHREFVVADNSTETIDVNDADSRQMLEASILQGLDMDPDKLSTETASANFNKLFKVTDKGIEVTEKGAVKTAYEALRAGKVDADAMAEVFADSEGHHGISSIELLVDWNKAIVDGTTLETHANLEIDAITSGMILTLLQIGTDKAIELAEKGGIYTADRAKELEAYVKHWLGDVTFTPGALIEAGKKHASAIESGTDKKLLKGQETNLQSDTVFKDLYSTIGVGMIEEVQTYKERLLAKSDKTESEMKQLAMLNEIGELNLKNIRSIAKSPVMVYIYGATVNSIKKKLTYSLGIDTLVKTIKKASKLLKEGKDAGKELGFVDMYIPNKVYKDRFGGKIADNMPEWKKLLHLDIDSGTIKTVGDVINATFGTAIETTFDSRLGFVDRNRDAVKTLEIIAFEAYQVRLAEEVENLLNSRYGEAKHEGESYKISKDDLVNINNKLTAQGYGHDIVWDEAGRDRVNQTLNKTGTKGGLHSSSVTVGDTKVGGQIKQNKAIVNTGAASTIPIHAIDGRMILETLNRELKGPLKGKYHGGNVYDAVVLSANKAMLTDTADYYNKNMIEIGFSRSIVADQMALVENMLSTMSDKQKVKMFNRLGLRPEGDTREDFTKEVNRLHLGTGKMLERLELAETTNKERLVNSGKEYMSGHLYQMGSGVVNIPASEVRAKEFPAITTLKTMLENKMIADRKQTAEEFASKTTGQPDYVLNLYDITQNTQVKSKANIAQMVNKGDKLKVSDNLTESLGSKDTVEIVGSVGSELNNSQKWWLNNMKNNILASDAGIVANSNTSEKTMSESGRELIEGVWVKQKEAKNKLEKDIITPSEAFKKNVNNKIECKE